MLYCPKTGQAVRANLSSVDCRFAVIFRQHLRHVCDAGQFERSVLRLTSIARADMTQPAQ
jgi:hypothetical protein